VYIPGRAWTPKSSLVWVDHDGTVEPLPFESGLFRRFDLDPDGNRLAVSKVEDGLFNVWIYDLERGTREKVTDDANNFSPVWDPAGDRLAFGSSRNGNFDVYLKPADALSPAEPLLAGELDEVPRSWSHDGSRLIIQEYNVGTGVDLWSVTLGEVPKKELIVRSPFPDNYAAFSPNEEWIAYDSELSGRVEVYVQPAHGRGGRVKVSPTGGNHPVWSPSERELYYRKNDSIVAVPYSVNEGKFRAGKSTVLFEVPGLLSVNDGDFDVSPDGQRFLMLRETGEDPPPTQIHVVLNWFEELNRFVPPNAE
jgi:Tol biopolymer transport system component